MRTYLTITVSVAIIVGDIIWATGTSLVHHLIFNLTVWE